MEKLNPDTVSEISSRLPIQSILQCRKVCRNWRSLFGKLKTGMIFACSRSRKACFELNYREQSSRIVSFNRIQEQQNVRSMHTGISSCIFVGICNGLVCYKTHGFVYIYNPITDERICIPGANYTCAGFGYCRSTDVYKVVQIMGNYIKVYTLGDDNGWRDKPKTTCNEIQGSGVYANGALYWLNKKPKRRSDHTEYYNCCEIEIVAFDVADETFQSIPSPPCHIHANLGSLGGNLYLCLPRIKQRKLPIRKKKQRSKLLIVKKKKKEPRERMMDIWVYYSNSLTWIKVFGGNRNVELNSKCQLLDLTESEILLWQNGVIFCYDIKSTISTKLWCVKPAQGNVQETPDILSLVSLKDLGDEPVDYPYVLPKKRI